MKILGKRLSEINRELNRTTLRDLVALVGMNSEPMNAPVPEITNTNLTTIKAGDSFSNAVRLMYEKRIRRLPIKSKDNQLLGVVTYKDLLRYALEISGKIHHSTRAIDKENFDIPVSSLMTKEVITISGDDDLRVAASRMMIFGVGGLIVEDVVGGNEKFGLITERDIIRTLSMKKSIEFLVSAMQYES